MYWHLMECRVKICLPKQSYKPMKLISNTGQKSEISHNKYDLKSKHNISLPLQ